MLTVEEKRILANLLAKDEGKPAMELEHICPSIPRDAVSETQLYASRPGVENFADPVGAFLKAQAIAGEVAVADARWDEPMVKAAKHDEIFVDETGFKWRQHFDERGEMVACLPIRED